MRSLGSTAVVVLMTFGSIQVVTAQESLPVQAGAGTETPVATTNGSGTLSGRALTASKGQVSRKRVQVRDAQSGRVTVSGQTDQGGFFSFAHVKPGTYIVEMLGENQSVLATSSVLTLEAGETLTVTLTISIAVTGGVLGSTAAMASFVAAGAAAAGVLAVKKVGDPTCPQ